MKERGGGEGEVRGGEVRGGEGRGREGRGVEGMTSVFTVQVRMQCSW